MHKRSSLWNRIVQGMAALALVAICGLASFAQPPGDKKVAKGKGEVPVPLPKEIVQPWTEAGAKVKWMSPDLGIVSGEYTLSPYGEYYRSLPAFSFNQFTWKEGLLAKLPPAEPFGINLNQSELPDAAFKELARLPNLQILHIRSTKVTDAGLKELASSKNLQSLKLHFGFTDAGLKHLASLKNLQMLDLSGMQVTDKGLKEVAAIKSLQRLRLRGPLAPALEATADALKELAALKSLKTLDLSSMKVTDAGLKELAQLKSLEILILVYDREYRNPQLTDKGLKELAALKNLKRLYVRNTGVTDDGLKALQAALPDCKINPKTGG